MSDNADMPWPSDGEAAGEDAAMVSMLRLTLDMDQQAGRIDAIEGKLLRVAAHYDAVVGLLREWLGERSHEVRGCPCLTCRTVRTLSAVDGTRAGR